jgi:hypothetical protein
MAFVYRPISRPMHISDLTSLVSRPGDHTNYTCRVVGYRALGARRGPLAVQLYWYGARTAPYQTHGANMGPFILGPALVASCGSPHNRMPRVPLAPFQLPPTSRVSPPIVSRGSARLLARQHRVVARPQPHACSRLVSQVARPLGAMPSPTVTNLRVTTCSLPHSSLESASVSVAAVTSTVAYAGAGCT